MRKIEVYVAGENRPVTIERKRKNRNIYLRVKEDRSLFVTTPYGIDIEYIIQFIKDNEKFILRRLNDPLPQTVEQLTGANGNETVWLGKHYPIEYVTAKTNFISFENDKLVYYLTDQSKETIEKTFFEFASKQLRMFIEERREEWDSWICRINGLEIPTITLKYMTSQWGSCNYRKNKISISLRLIHYPVQCLDYVLLHEYAHLLVPNHSKEFYDVVKTFMPDYKVYSDLLKGTL